MVHISFWFMLMTLIYIGRKKHTIKKSTEASVEASKKAGLESNADETNSPVNS